MFLPARFLSAPRKIDDASRKPASTKSGHLFFRSPSAEKADAEKTADAPPRSTRKSGRNKSRIITVRRLFRECERVRAPLGRAGYAWPLPEMARFLMEIEDAADGHDRDAPVYLGFLTGQRDDYGDLHVEDGVKRLMAIVLFLAAARDRLGPCALRRRIEQLLHPEKRDDTQTWMELPPPDQDWFARAVMRPSATLALPASGGSPPRNQILLAARFIANALDEYTRDDLEERTLCLLDQATTVLAASDIGSRPHHTTVKALPAPTDITPQAATPYRDLSQWLTAAEEQ
jgi:hypothetical protein